MYIWLMFYSFDGLIKAARRDVSAMLSKKQSVPPQRGEAPSSQCGGIKAPRHGSFNRLVSGIIYNFLEQICLCICIYICICIYMCIYE